MSDPVWGIMDAIREQESHGNYNAQNDSGAFGAYQFMPSTWESTAASYGLDPNDKSPDNQDRMAYNLMSEYYNTYQDPRAVASMWYSGQPDYTKNGEGSGGPSISGYVDSVMSKMGGGAPTGNQYYDQFLGQTMNNGSNGCMEAVGLMGAGTSSFLANMYNNGIVSVPGAVSNAEQQGIPIVPFDPGNLSNGDAVVYGNNDHIVLSDGNGGYYGNSSEQNRIIHGSDIMQMGGLMPTKIIKTGGGGHSSSFNYQAKDAHGNPFFNIMANIRTSNRNEPFDQQSIMGILGQGVNTPSVLDRQYKEYLFGPDYNTDMLKLNADVAKYVAPAAKNIMDYRMGKIKEDTTNEANQMTQENNLAKTVGVMGLVNRSNSVDNRRNYATLAAMYGLKVPDGTDQFVSDKDLLSAQIQAMYRERQMDAQQQQADRAFKFQKEQADIKNGLLARELYDKENGVGAYGGRASGSGGTEKGLSPSQGKILGEMVEGPLAQAATVINKGNLSSSEAKAIWSQALSKAEINSSSVGDSHAGEFLSGVVDQYQGDLMNKWGKNFEGLDKGSNNPISRFLGLSGYN